MAMMLESYVLSVAAVHASLHIGEDLETLRRWFRRDEASEAGDSAEPPAKTYYDRIRAITGHAVFRIAMVAAILGALSHPTLLFWQCYLIIASGSLQSIA